MKCPYCQKQIDISIEKSKQQNLSSEVDDIEPITIIIEEPKENVTELVSKKIRILSPTVGEIEKDTYQKELPQGEYWKEEFKKDIIVLHFTAGRSWESAYSVFKQPGRVATPFIVDKEGPKYIVKLFDEKYWSYHLGIKELGYSNNWANDKRSIGIEIVNIGPVWLKDGMWRDWTKRTYPENSIVRGKNRDADGGVVFPDEQVEAVCRLVNHLCNKWDIPRQVPKDKTAFQLPEIGEFKGIVAHQMFRQDKYDMGVVWPWDKMIERCKLDEV